MANILDFLPSKLLNKVVFPSDGEAVSKTKLSKTHASLGVSLISLSISLILIVFAVSSLKYKIVNLSP
jgi:hypothetical protein